MKILRIVTFLVTALFLNNLAHATVTVTLHGTMTSGTDTSGVFGSPGANLAGQTVTIVYTIDESTGTQTHSCSYACTSGISGATGGATIQVGTSTPFVDSSGASANRQLSGWGPIGYLMNFDTGVVQAEVLGNSTVTTSSTIPNFDWRSPFSDSVTTDPNLTSVSGFTINDGVNTANGYFTVTSIGESGGSCSSVTSAALTIDTSAAGHQPNILGGTQNQSTDITVTLGGVSSSEWYAVVFGDADTALHPTSSNEALVPPGSLPNSTTGLGSVPYYTSISSGLVNDQVVASVCESNPSPAVNVYEYYPYLNTAHTKKFDIGQSQVSDSAFTASSALSQSQIQTIFSETSAWLTHFYLDTTNPGNGGWIDPAASGTTDTFVSTYSTYCPYVDDDSNPICPVAASGTTSADAGVSASQLIATAAVNNSVNPAVLLATLEKEYGITLKTTRPSDLALDQAMGVGNSDFQAQINSGAHTFNTRFNEMSTDDFPYFFATNASEVSNYPDGNVTQSIQYSWNTNPADPCNETNHDDCAIVGLSVANRSTYAQYRYTPFVQTTAPANAPCGGGYCSFEYWWLYGSSIW